MLGGYVRAVVAEDVESLMTPSRAILWACDKLLVDKEWKLIRGSKIST